MKNFDKIKTYIFFLTIFLILLNGFFLISKRPLLLVDEVSHYKMIIEISNGNLSYSVFTSIAELPGYHLFISLLRLIFKISYIRQTRFLNILIALFSMYIFFRLVLKINHKYIYRKTLQFFFFPYLFIFFFLIYTDVFSLLLVMLSFLFLLNNQYKRTGLVSLLSILVRQNNIIWSIFFIFYLFITKYKLRFTKNNLIDFLKKIWIFVLSFFGLLLFFIFNKGFTLGAKGMHPVSIYQENIFFILFSYFILFFPVVISQLPEIIRLLKKKRYLIIILLVIYIDYIIFFKANHNNNIYEVAPSFLRNKILKLALLNYMTKTFFFVPISLSILSLGLTKLHNKIYYLLYPFTLLFLTLQWLIEPRYYLIPFMFFLLFRKTPSSKIEYVIIIFYFILSFFVFFGTINRRFFL